MVSWSPVEEEDVTFVWGSPDAQEFDGPPPVGGGVDEEGEDQYRVDEIAGCRRDGDGDYQYLVRYTGYRGNYWQDLSELLDAPKAIDDFHRSHPAAPSPTKDDWDKVREERPNWHGFGDGAGDSQEQGGVFD
jgi:hypothetical protein